MDCAKVSAPEGTISVGFSEIELRSEPGERVVSGAALDASRAVEGELASSSNGSSLGFELQNGHQSEKARVL